LRPVDGWSSGEGSERSLAASRRSSDASGRRPATRLATFSPAHKRSLRRSKVSDTGIQAEGGDSPAVAPADGDTTMWTGLLHTGLVGSFLRLPHVAADTEALTRHGARAAIYGLPFDATNISRTGANYGPRGIREVSCQFTSYNATLDFDLVGAL